MCEFCHKHGEGKKWYLQAKNYSEDLMSDLRRRKFIADFFSKPGDLTESMGKLEKLSRAPAFVKGVLAPYISGRQKKIHFGQVLPMEDIERIFGFVSSVIRTACLCRQENLGTEQRYCYGISMAPQGGEFRKIIEEIDASYLTGPDTAGLETLTREEALDSFRQHEKEGLCHSVWTFMAPFIGGICNCDRSDCYAMRATVTYGIPVMFRAEYVAEVNPELCNGCRQCMRVCQFGAMGYSAANKKVVIDPRRCYGCGVCRASCTKDAITLNDRTSVPIAASIW
ncbi:MAG: 4Fe-4S dicluster domain-containing protein [Dehalococcoidia bacterium]|nr:MAG: 4Fe-4S dicluster domain-containing protein [Dehalococcoidia bacterium]